MLCRGFKMDIISVFLFIKHVYKKDYYYDRQGMESEC